jgi:hypothetical protein
MIFVVHDILPSLDTNKNFYTFYVWNSYSLVKNLTRINNPRLPLTYPLSPVIWKGVTNVISLRYQ